MSDDRFAEWLVGLAGKIGSANAVFVVLVICGCIAAILTIAIKALPF